MTSHPMPAALPKFKGELRYVRKLTPLPGCPEMCRIEEPVLQQAVDIGGPHENLRWRDVPTVQEITAQEGG